MLCGCRCAGDFVGLRYRHRSNAAALLRFGHRALAPLQMSPIHASTIVVRTTQSEATRCLAASRFWTKAQTSIEREVQYVMRSKTNAATRLKRQP